MSIYRLSRLFAPYYKPKPIYSLPSSPV